MNYFVYKALYVLKHFKLFDFFNQMRDAQLDNYIKPMWIESIWSLGKRR